MCSEFDVINILSSSKSSGKYCYYSNHTKINLILVPYYLSFLKGHLRLFKILLAFIDLLRNSDKIFVRYPEPFIWLLLSLNIFFQKKIYFHIVSNPFELISKRYKILRFIICMLLKLDLMCIRFFQAFSKSKIKYSCNGAVVPKIFKKILGNDVQPIIESSFRSNEYFYPSCKHTPENNKFRLILVSRLVEGKRTLEFIKFLQQTNFQLAGSTLTLSIVGGGPLIVALKELVQSDPIIMRHVEIIGELTKQTQVLEAIYRSDCMVISSESESGPRVCIESLFVGRPVISTDVGYVFDVGYIDETVFKFEFGNTKSFELALTKILAHDFIKLESLCKKNVEKFTVDRFFASVFSDEN